MREPNKIYRHTYMLLHGNWNTETKQNSSGKDTVRGKIYTKIE